MQEYDNPQDYQDTLKNMQNSTVFQQRFGQHSLYQNNHWKQYAFCNAQCIPWPEDLWNECWKVGYADFTTDSWGNLSWEQQFQYAKSYQGWYTHHSEMYHTTQTIEDIVLELQLIPPGRFWMGSPENEEERQDNETRHRVLIDNPFYIGKYPVTQKQWQRIMGNNPSRFKRAKSNKPVENISWNDCKEFCEKLDLDFPTEAQWEYACRGGTTTAFNIGDSFTKGIINCDNSFEQTTLVSNLPNANSWGCYDFHGNVWEWCKDRHSSYTKEDIINPIGPDKGSWFVIRGGCWGYPANLARSACRGWYLTAYRTLDEVGFRFALNIPNKSQHTRRLGLS